MVGERGLEGRDVLIGPTTSTKSWTPCRGSERDAHRERRQPRRRDRHRRPADRGGRDARGGAPARRCRGLVGATASAVAIAYLWRASQTPTVLDWALCGVMAIAAVYLSSLVDSRTPLLVADDLGVRIRLGDEWRGLPWTRSARSPCTRAAAGSVTGASCYPAQPRPRARGPRRPGPPPRGRGQRCTAPRSPSRWASPPGSPPAGRASPTRSTPSRSAGPRSSRFAPETLPGRKPGKAPKPAKEPKPEKAPKQPKAAGAPEPEARIVTGRSRRLPSSPPGTATSLTPGTTTRHRPPRRPSPRLAADGTADDGAEREPAAVPSCAASSAASARSCRGSPRAAGTTSTRIGPTWTPPHRRAADAADAGQTPPAGAT